MLAVDIAPGAGIRNRDGCLYATESPGLGCAPDPGLLGEPVAGYSA
jgi:hypothetical protein